MLTAAHDYTVRIWDVESGRSLRVFEGHPFMPVQAAWMPDQRHVISIDDGAEVRVWDTGRVTELYPGFRLSPR